jgi:hypothetical protein
VFDPTEGVDDSDAWSVPRDGSGDAGVELSSIACCVTAGDGSAESTSGILDLTAGSSLLMLVSSTWKLSVSMASLNPPVIAEADPVVLGKKLMTADVGEPTMTSDGVLTVVGGGMSMATDDADESMSIDDDGMSIDDDGMSMLIADGESMVTGNVDESTMTGEGDGESVDPDFIIPMVGANWRGSTPAIPMLEGFQIMERAWDPANSTAIRQGLGHMRVYPGSAP